MLDWLFADGGAWFSVPALFGTGLFVIQIVLGELGGDLDLDGDVDLAGDVGGAGDIRLLSLQTIAAFFVGAGWMGIVAYRVADASFLVASLIALASGVGVGWLAAWLMAQLYKMQRSGNISIAGAIGLTGSVTVVVPPADEGRGAVSLVIDGRRREFDAVQAGGESLRTNASVRVARVDRENNTLVVEPA
ncbi:MAG: hypothetical protein AAFX79_12635 [Planctomycetota bacterium]